MRRPAGTCTSRIRPAIVQCRAMLTAPQRERVFRIMDGPSIVATRVDAYDERREGSRQAHPAAMHSDRLSRSSASGSDMVGAGDPSQSTVRQSNIAPLQKPRFEGAAAPASRRKTMSDIGAVKGDPTWPDELYELLRQQGVTQFAYVPDAGHRVLIDRSLADPDVHSVALTTEEEGVGLLAGAHLGGARGVLLMQSSGAGNCINFLSLVKGGNFPLLMLLSMRGEFGE